MEEGGHLVVITSVEENAFVNSLTGGYYTWLGIDDQSTPYVFESVTGENISYTQWASGEPSGYEWGQRCVYMSNSQWYSYYCWYGIPYVCEVPPSLDRTCSSEPRISVSCSGGAGTGSCGSSPTRPTTTPTSSVDLSTVLPEDKYSFDYDWSMQLGYGDSGYLAWMSDRSVDGAIRNGVLGKGRYGGGSWDEW
jgi:hypothetical protein